MATQQFDIASPLAPDDAFDRLVDLTRVNEWDRGVTNPRQIHGTGHQLGSRYEVTVVGFDGKPTTVVYELLEVDRPARFVMEGVNAVFCAHDAITIEPTDTGCTVTYSAGLELLEEDPPLTPVQLDSLFVKIAAVAQDGLRNYLNP
jgi:hypothetical protein